MFIIEKIQKYRKCPALPGQSLSDLPITLYEMSTQPATGHWQQRI